MTPAQNKEIVTRAMDALAQGDTRPFTDAMADNFSWRMMGSNNWDFIYEGKRPVCVDLFGVLRTQYATTYTNTASHIFADGDHVVVESRGKVTTTSGEDYNNRYCMVLRMEGGKMVEAREYCDTALADVRLKPLPARTPEATA